MAKAKHIIQAAAKLTEAKSKMSLIKLARSTVRFEKDSNRRNKTTTPGDRKKRAGTRKVKSVRVIPAIGVKKLAVSSETQGAKGSYTTYMDFFGIDFVPKKTSEHTLKVFQPTSKKYFYMKPIDAEKTKIAVRCLCQDFRHRFSWQDKSQNALALGKPKSYIRKTTTWPKVNPKDIPGMCKHLHALTDLLAKNMFFK